MIYLLWGLFNTGLAILFIIVCFKAVRLIKEKLGGWATIVFVTGVICIFGRTSSDKDNTEPTANRNRTWKFHPADSLKNNSRTATQIDLEKTLISTYHLYIDYGIDKQLDNIITLSATTGITGFQSGTTWMPGNIVINRTEDANKFQYEVDGTVKWNILGNAVYYEPKLWKGIILLD